MKGHYRCDEGAATPAVIPVRGGPPPTVNIHTDGGARVLFHARGGWDGESDHACMFLERGSVYTVARTEVHSWHTKVELSELPGHWFNSVMFCEVQEAP